MTDETNPPTPTEPEKPKPTPEEIKALLAMYGAVHDKRAEAKATYDALDTKCSAILKTLAERAGKGRFRFRGDKVLLTSRKHKHSDKETFYFRGESDKDVILGGDE